MADVLEKILERRRLSVAQAKKERPLSQLESVLKNSRNGGPSFLEAISKQGQISLIAEMKRKSPSAGDIREPYDVAQIAASYKKAGASALSVLTETDFFGGDIADLAGVRLSSDLPVLRKDFIFDTYQIIEAKIAGASAILLIADMLDEKLLIELAAHAESFGLDTLVEIFTPESVEPALRTGSKIIGINSRNLRTLEMKPQNLAELGARIPNDRILVAESGIKSADDVRRLKELRVSAMLVGESLLKQSDLEKATRTLVAAGE